MAIINFIMSATLTNWVGKLLESLYKAIGNFGWTVVVFSILLKVILSPLDIWQRVSTKNQQKKMEAIKPKLEKLEKQYKNNPDLLKQKQYEVQREAKINVFATCLPLIVTMVVFFVVFAGFRALVTYENEVIVEKLDSTYVEYIVDFNESYSENPEEYSHLTQQQHTEVLALYSNAGVAEDDYSAKWDILKAYCEDETHGVSDKFVEYDELFDFDKENGTSYYEAMQTALANKYQELLDGDRWLWVKNIFRPDTGTTVVPDKKAYTSTGAGGIGASIDDTQRHTSYSNLTNPAAAVLNKTGTWDFKKWNGYFILPLLSLLTSFLSTWIMQRNGPTNAMGTQEQQAQQQKQMKMMTYLMPVMLAVFAMLYSAAFAIYYFMSNVMATLTTLLVNGIMKFMDKRKEAQNPTIIR